MINRDQIKTCCRYGFSVNLLVDCVEYLIENLENGEELTEKEINNVKTRIENLRKHEVGFKELLGIED